MNLESLTDNRSPQELALAFEHLLSFSSDGMSVELVDRDLQTGIEKIDADSHLFLSITKAKVEGEEAFVLRETDPINNDRTRTFVFGPWVRCVDEDGVFAAMAGEEVGALHDRLVSGNFILREEFDNARFAARIKRAGSKVLTYFGAGQIEPKPKNQRRARSLTNV